MSPRLLLAGACCVLLLLLVWSPLHLTSWLDGAERVSSAGLPGWSAAHEEAAALMSCFNAPTPGPSNATTRSDTFKGFLAGRPANLVLDHVHWSDAPAPLNLTVCTMATPGRMRSVEHLCASWKGVLAVAVYMPLEAKQDSFGAYVMTAESRAKLQRASARVAEVFSRTDKKRALIGKGCSLRTLFTYELMGFPGKATGGTPNHLMYSMLPINSLRNTALLAATTPLVLMADADLMLASSLSEQLAKPSIFSEVAAIAAARNAIIVPTFETPEELRQDKAMLVAIEALHGDASALKAAVDDNQLQPFAAKTFYDGHKCTNFKQWYQATAPYKIRYTPACEPWMIADRSHLPQWDVRYRGYGWNKVSHVAHVNETFAGMKVFPGLFMVHLPHRPSSALHTYWKAKDISLAGGAEGAEAFNKVTALYNEEQALLAKGTFVPVTDARTQRCRQELSWWSGGGDGGSGQQQRQAPGRRALLL
ncbi:hypothetical protein FOA52_013581 [Chlamydomonas sp. UWO 241]|nr:hypothetical protein FOA52_013581 [Chlamydomonas sp. UWO 241]